MFHEVFKYFFEKKTMLLLSTARLINSCMKLTVSKSKQSDPGEKKVTSLVVRENICFRLSSTSQRQENFSLHLLIVMHNITICYSKYLLRFYVLGHSYDMLTHLRTRTSPKRECGCEKWNLTNFKCFASEPRRSYFPSILC
jgi:hypothetical protein